MQHVQALCTCLGAPDSEVLLEVLKTLVSYVRRSHTSSIRFQGYQALSNRLTALAAGWGGKEEVCIFLPMQQFPACGHDQRPWSMSQDNVSVVQGLLRCLVCPRCSALCQFPTPP